MLIHGTAAIKDFLTAGVVLFPIELDLLKPSKSLCFVPKNGEFFFSCGRFEPPPYFKVVSFIAPPLCSSKMTSYLLDSLIQVASEPSPPPKSLSPAFTSLSRPKQKHIACVECRQQKSKCDAHIRQPCSRCAKKGLNCDRRSNYKRTVKRARIAQMEAELSELTRLLLPRNRAELFRKLPSLAHDKYNDTSDLANGSDGNEQGSPHDYAAQQVRAIRHLPPQVVSSPQTIPSEALVCTEKSIDSITLQPETIRALFLEYVEHYHTILPVVCVSKGPERLFRLCPALFWVIMFVSLRRYSVGENKHLLLQLSPLVKGVLAEIMISPITRYNPVEEDEPVYNALLVFAVQAFLLYSYWPPITSSLSADSSYNTVGNAIFQAIRIGLHTLAASAIETDHKMGFSLPPSQLLLAREARKTWIACNVVSQTIATAFGFPAFVQFERSTLNEQPSKSRHAIPPSIIKMMEIARFENMMAQTLKSSQNDQGLVHTTEQLPLIKLLLRNLDDLEIKLFRDSERDPFRKFQILTSRVHLLTYYFMDAKNTPPFDLSKGLVQLYSASVALISYCMEIQAQNKMFIKYLPGVYILNIWQAAFVIGRIYHSNIHEVVDAKKGRQCYEHAIDLAAKASILKHDMADRLSGIMRNMWLLFRTLHDQGTDFITINVRTRMSASVFFDCLFVLRDKAGILKHHDGGNKHDEHVDEHVDGHVMEDSYRGKDHWNSHESADRSTMSTLNEPKPGAGSDLQRHSHPLSHTKGIEPSVQKIIRTVPLDPKPISQGKQRSSIFNVVNNSAETTPHAKSERNSPLNHNSPTSLRQSAPATVLPWNQSANTIHPNEQYLAISLHTQPPPPHLHQTTPNELQIMADLANSAATPKSADTHLEEQIFTVSPQLVGLDNLEMYNLDSHLLWKDVDSVMNDFGFPTL